MREWTTIDKTGWPRGPWREEPDKIQWVDKETGLDCLMHRGPVSGSWCGYVGVPPGHPYYGVGYHNCALKPPCGEDYCGHAPESLVDVHGGLTYSGKCRPTDDESVGICHAPPCAHEDVWWLGFDCAHSEDLAPRLRATMEGLATKHPELALTAFERNHEIYRDRLDVQQWVSELARQLKEVASVPGAAEGVGAERD